MNGADAHKLARRVRAKMLTLLIRRSFAAWGKHSSAVPPLRVEGARSIRVGSHVRFGPGCLLHAAGGVITIGDGCSFTGDCTVSAASRVSIGSEVLVARSVHIADYDHAFSNPALPVIRQGITNIAPVTIGDGARIGHGAVILSGVSIGVSAVIAAGAVVTRDVPAHCLAVGAPARVVKSWAPGPRPGGARHAGQPGLPG